MSAGNVQIAEVLEVCERMAFVNRELFERLGGWVADEADPAHQRWFAVACHRHAWHAELWAERRPDVPLEAAPSGREWDSVEHADRARWYTEQVAALQAELATVETRLDPLLDPSTARVIQLVAADLADLAAVARRP